MNKKQIEKLRNKWLRNINKNEIESVVPESISGIFKEEMDRADTKVGRSEMKKVERDLIRSGSLRS